MKNQSLVIDHLERSKKRLLAVQLLFDHQSYADVVRESQEVVELTLKALLRASHIEIPRIHDVSEILQEEKDKLPTGIQKELEKICDISRNLRRDRELAFYGSEDLTPSDFYKRKDAEKAMQKTQWLVEIVVNCLNIKK